LHQISYENNLKTSRRFHEQQLTEFVLSTFVVKKKKNGQRHKNAKKG